jgi:hypothetical protein
MDEAIAQGGQETNPLIQFGRMDDWAQLALDVRRIRMLMRAGLSPKEALAAFRGELCVVSLRTYAA